MKYGFVLSVTLGVAVSLNALPAFAMEDLRSQAQPGAPVDLDAIEGDFLDGAFGLEALASETDLGETRGRNGTVLQVTDQNGVNFGNSVDGDTGSAAISDGSFANSSFGQAAVVSGNNNNVQLSTTVNINLY